jgi:hypothetical protein
MRRRSSDNIGVMTARRSFLARFGAAAAVLGLGSAKASAERPDEWQPARDAKDDWFDRIPGKHRLFFDALTAQGTTAAMGFADNYFTGSKSGYGLEARDLAVVICLRHMSTPFAFTDAFWAKYGAPMGESISSRSGTSQPQRSTCKARSTLWSPRCALRRLRNGQSSLFCRGDRAEGRRQRGCHLQRNDRERHRQRHFVAAGIIAKSIARRSAATCLLRQATALPTLE